jgi:uncharacterized linocin/CFP29 family protein
MRGADDFDLDPLLLACKRLAVAEDRAIFHGFEEGGIEGIVGPSPHAALEIVEDYTNYPATVVAAIETLQSGGIQGPFGIALGPRCYTGLFTASDPNGFPVLERLRQIVDGPLVRAPGVDGAVVLTARGGDFRLTVGRDISIGYRSHDDEQVRLFLVESLSFQNLTPEAAVPLVYAS